MSAPLRAQQLGWPLTILTISLPVVAWLLAEPLTLRTDSAYAVLLSIGRIAGLLAIMMYCVNIIFATRLVVLESLFGGLNKLYIAHHIIGGLSLCFALLHAWALTLRVALFSVEDAWNFSLPSTSDIPRMFGILGLWLFIVLIILTLYVKLPYQWWLRSHKLLIVAFFAIALHVVLVPGDINTLPWIKAYLITFMVLALISALYRTILPRFFTVRWRYQIKSAAIVAPVVIEIKLTPKGRPMSYRSGQFAFFRIRHNELPYEWHPFTISSPPQNGSITITVKSLGDFTSRLVTLSDKLIDCPVDIEGAFGRFYLKHFRRKRQIWIAGGIGVTPFMSMVSDITNDYDIDLYYCTKTKDEQIGIKNLSVMNDGPHALKVIPVIESESGSLSAKQVIKLSGDISNADILICGPPGMMHALTRQFRSLGVSKHRIHTEEFSIS